MWWIICKFVPSQYPEWAAILGFTWWWHNISENSILAASSLLHLWAEQRRRGCCHVSRTRNGKVYLVRILIFFFDSLLNNILWQVTRPRKTRAHTQKRMDRDTLSCELLISSTGRTLCRVEIFWHVVIFGGIVIAMVILGSFKGIEFIWFQLPELINALKWNLSKSRVGWNFTDFYELTISSILCRCILITVNTYLWAAFRTLVPLEFWFAILQVH